MKFELSIQILISVISIVCYVVILTLLSSAITRYRKKTKVLEKRLVYIKKFFVFVLFSVLLVVIAFIWGIDISGVLIFASSFFAIVGVALFASWSVLSNITSGIIIFFSFPYKIGDNIKIIDGENSVSGEILDMTLFHIQIKSDEGNHIYYPNNLAIQKPIIKLKD